jgi:dipeptidyl aminopeptidase/acylaminoacyl peptidase
VTRVASDLRVIGTDGTGERILYQCPGTHPSALDWSPDGSQVLAALTDHSTLETQIAIISTMNASVVFPAVR